MGGIRESAPKSLYLLMGRGDILHPGLQTLTVFYAVQGAHKPVGSIGGHLRNGLRAWAQHRARQTQNPNFVMSAAHLQFSRAACP